MLSFKSFLYESKKFNFEKFKSDCAEYLSQLATVQKNKRALYHGTKLLPNDYEIRTWKERSGPKDTPTIAHDIFNEFFQDRFGFKARNWMFATPDYTAAKIYSATGQSPGVIFPIGHWEFITVDTSDNEKLAYDLTTWHAGVVGRLKAESDWKISHEAATEQAARLIANKMHHTHWNTRDVKRALENPQQNEIMFKCKKFYIFNFTGNTYLDVIKPYIDSL